MSVSDIAGVVVVIIIISVECKSVKCQSIRTGSFLAGFESFLARCGNGEAEALVGVTMRRPLDPDR